MNQITQMIVTVICSVMASAGFWTFLQKQLEKKRCHKPVSEEHNKAHKR